MVKLFKEEKVRYANSVSVSKIMQDILLREREADRNKEHFWLVCLDSNNKLILLELISFDSIPADVKPTDVFSFALQKKSSKLIMVHNRPNDVEPTVRDKAMTEYFAAIGKFLNVPVIDHLIINETEFFSFAETGLLQKIMAETPIDLSFANVESRPDSKTTGRVRKKATAENKALAADNRFRSAIKKLMQKGLTTTEIVNVMGLSRSEVERLKK